MKLHILAFGSHPDDVEISCAGTIIKHVKAGKHAGIVDLTMGELGTRGTVSLRMRETRQAASVLGIQVRVNLGMKDGFFVNNRLHQLAVIRKIRLYRPDVVLCPAHNDRHPDHGRASALIKEACFLAGLEKIHTVERKKNQQAWRPAAVYEYVQFRYLSPSFVVDISAFFEQKMKAVMCYASQFYNPKSAEPETFISSKSFPAMIRSRAVEFGKSIGKEYGEGFIADRPVGVGDITALI